MKTNEDLNSWESFKKDMKGVTETVFLFMFIFFLIFPPLLFARALHHTPADKKLTLWRNALCHWAFWTWWGYFTFVIIGVWYTWHLYLNRGY